MVDATVWSLLNGEFSSAIISFNDHAADYCTVEQAIERGLYEHVQWASDEERDTAVATNRAVTVQWYPDTPIGFLCVAASSLKACFEAILEWQEENEERKRASDAFDAKHNLPPKRDI